MSFNRNVWRERMRRAMPTQHVFAPGDMVRVRRRNPYHGNTLYEFGEIDYDSLFEVESVREAVGSWNVDQHVQLTRSPWVNDSYSSRVFAGSWLEFVRRSDGGHGT